MTFIFRAIKNELSIGDNSLLKEGPKSTAHLICHFLIIIGVKLLLKLFFVIYYFLIILPPHTVQKPDLAFDSVPQFAHTYVGLAFTSTALPPHLLQND